MGEIIIGDPVMDKQRLTSRVSASDDLEKYLKEEELFIEYDAPIYADESILHLTSQ